MLAQKLRVCAVRLAASARRVRFPAVAQCATARRKHILLRNAPATVDCSKIVTDMNHPVRLPSDFCNNVANLVAQCGIQSRSWLSDVCWELTRMGNWMEAAKIVESVADQAPDIVSRKLVGHILHQMAGSGAVDESLVFLRAVLDHGVRGNVVMLTSILRGCSRHPQYAHYAVAVDSLRRSFDIPVQPLYFAMFIHNCGSTGDATALDDAVQSLVQLLRTFHGRELSADELRSFYCSSAGRWARWSEIGLAAAIQAYDAQNRPAEAIEVWNTARNLDFGLSTSVCEVRTTDTDCAVHNGGFSWLAQALLRLKGNNEEAQGMIADKALSVLQLMITSGVRRTSVTYTFAATSLLRGGRPRLLRDLWQALLTDTSSNTVQWDTQLTDALLQCAAKASMWNQ